MIERYYYIRDCLDRAPRVTVCLLENEDGFVSRGVALCSFNDNPCKKTGRALALARARKANGTEDNHSVPLSSLRNVESSGWLSYLYEFEPELTELESRILKRNQ
jgi:hypothetical protein